MTAPPPPPAPVLVGDSIDCRLRSRQILRGAYVDAVPGRVTALVGRTGSGKTTLFEILVGRRRPDGGHIRWMGERVPRPSLAALARRGLCYHPDRPWLAMHLSPRDHFALLGSRDWRAAAEALGVVAWLDRPARSLSGGELRLTELALGLALRPAAVVLDEPFRGLEPRHRETVGDALRTLAVRGVAVLYADHDARLVQQTADRLFGMESGRTRLVEDFKARPLRDWYHEWPSPA